MHAPSDWRSDDFKSFGRRRANATGTKANNTPTSYLLSRTSNSSLARVQRTIGSTLSCLGVPTRLA